jgi:pimeloyl-ACP methyl ester carboxylesterase
MKVVNSEKKTKGLPKVLLIHGFGHSTTYWRTTVNSLKNEGYEVYSLDLLGQCYSSKPFSVHYSISLWAIIIEDYITKVKAPSGDENGVMLMGNRLGSLVALAAATGDYYDDEGLDKSELTNRIKGICMFNCANGLNRKGTLNEPSSSPTSKAIFSVLCSVLELLIFRNKLLLPYVLDDIVTKSTSQRYAPKPLH